MVWSIIFFLLWHPVEVLPESLFNVTRIVPLGQITDSQCSDSQCSGVISIGNFDGVHRGHAALLGEVRSLADELAGPAIAVVLDPHPAAILRPQQLPARLSSIQRRAELMSAFGIDYLVVCGTTPELLRLSATTFFQSLVIQRLAARAVVEGPNFFFGRGRGGNIETLGELCRQSDVRLSVVESTVDEGEMISSTRIRTLLSQTRVEQASRLLGSPYRLAGRVVSGEKRGREIGFPTANLADIETSIPAPAVYGGFAIHAGQKYEAAIHIGPSPTFDTDGRSRVEIHLLDFQGDLYGETLLVDFVTHVRDIARFDSANMLAGQLARDVKTIRSRLERFRTRES